jgi:tripeptide aminopeptidase
MTSYRIFAAAAAVALVSPAVVQSQEPAAATSVRAALDRIRADNEWTIEQQVSICEIPAPPFKEERRAAEM